MLTACVIAIKYVKRNDDSVFSSMHLHYFSLHNNHKRNHSIQKPHIYQLLIKFLVFAIYIIVYYCIHKKQMNCISASRNDMMNIFMKMNICASKLKKIFLVFNKYSEMMIEMQMVCNSHKRVSSCFISYIENYTLLLLSQIMQFMVF